MKKNSYTESTVGRPLVIPVFVMNSGCRHRCIFCNQKITAGNYPQTIDQEYFARTVEAYLSWNKDKSRRAEIAFYGGSFTGIDASYQENLLSWAQSYIKAGLIHSVRISTRPDYINTDILAFLKKYNVATVEIGAQSFVDDVLQFAERGHDAADTVKAIGLLKEENFRTCIHLMAGLPKDTEDGFLYSLEKTIKLKPDMARIHPVVVFRGTALAAEFVNGNYLPLSLADAISLCSRAWEKLAASGIRVIRTGLHWTREMENDGVLLAGPLHPAFGNLVLAEIYYQKTRKLLMQVPATSREIIFNLHSRDISNFRGLHNNNIAAIKKLYPQAVIDVKTSMEQKRGLISAAIDQKRILTTSISGIT